MFVGAAFASGCGEAEPSGPQVTLRVTRDFGRELIDDERLPLKGHATPVRLLKASHEVRVSEYGYVEAIDALRQSWRGGGAEQQTIWVVNVNGIETDMEPTKLPLVDGDIVQFDLRDAETRLDVRATVGAFPETFAGAIVGSLFPVKVHCAEGFDRACSQVKGALRAAGVDPNGRPPRQPPVSKAAREARSIQVIVRRATVLVGPWSHWRHRRWPARIDSGPGDSGVFATFTPHARSIRLLDWDGNPVRTVGAGSGLVAAMRPTEPDLQWLVTGVDRAGVERAAAALNPDDLRDAFAVAVTADGVEKLPLPPD
jgi:hypothetical protein